MLSKIEQYIKNATTVIANSGELPKLTPTFLAQILYSKNEAFRQFDKLIPWVSGSEDLRVLLRHPTFNLTKENNMLFIWLQPYVHSMSLCLKLEDDNSVTAFIIDSQGWQWRYYPTRDIIYALVEYFGPNTKIILSNTPWQSTDIQISCPLFTKIIGEYTTKYGDILFNELSSLMPQLEKLANISEITQNSPDVANLNIYRLPENVMPDGLEKYVEQELIKLAPKASKEQSIWYEKIKTVRAEVTREAMQSYVKKSAHIDTEEQSSLYFNHVIEWQGLHAEMFLPSVMAEPVFDFKFTEPATLELSLHHKHRFYFGNTVLFTSEALPNPEKNSLSNIFVNHPEVKVVVDENNFTVKFSAQNITKLYNAFSDLTKQEVQWHLFTQGLGHYQSLATALLGQEATEALKIYAPEQIKKTGLGIDQVNLALKYFLSIQENVSVLAEHYSLDDQEQKIAQQIATEKLTGVRYIVFSFAMNAEHQVLVIVDTIEETITQIDSQNANNLTAIQDLFQLSIFKDVFKSYKFGFVPAVEQQDNWSCGIHVVLNAQKFFSQNLITDDFNDLTSATRKILRAAIQMGDIVHSQQLQKTAEKKIAKLLLALLKDKSGWIQKLHEKLTDAYNENYFSLQHFIDNYEKTNLICSEFLSTLSSFLLIKELISDDNLLESCVKNLVNFAACAEAPEKKASIIGFFDSEIKLNDSNTAISRYQAKQQLEQSFKTFLSSNEIPEFIDDSYIDYFECLKETFSFYLSFCYAKRVKELAEKQSAHNTQLKTEIRRQQLSQNNYERKLQNIIDAVLKNTDLKPRETFECFLKRQVKKLVLLTPEQWRELLVHFKQMPEKLDQVIENTVTLSNADEAFSFGQTIILSLLWLKLDKIASSVQNSIYFNSLIDEDFKKNAVSFLLLSIKKIDSEEWGNIFLYYLSFNNPLIFSGKVNFIKDFIEYAATLPRHAQFDFVKSQYDNFLKTNDFNQVEIMAFLLGKAFYNCNFYNIFINLKNKDNGYNGYRTEMDISLNVGKFIFNDKFSTLSLSESIKEIDEIAVILHVTPLKDKKAFLDAVRKTVAIPVYALHTILEELPPEDRFSIITEYQNDILSVNDLAALLRVTPEEKIIDLIELKIDLIKTENDIKKITENMSLHLRIILILRLRNLSFNLDLICDLFKDISNLNERLSIIIETIKHFQLPITAKDVATIIKYFPRSAKIEIALQLFEYLPNNLDLFQAFKEINLHDNRKLMRGVLNRITEEPDCITAIYIILSPLLKNDNDIKIAIQTLNNIRNVNEDCNNINHKNILHLILNVNFNNIIISHSNKIKSSQELFVILKLIPEQIHFDFICENLSKIENTNNLRSLIDNFLIAKNSFKIIQKLPHLIKDAQDLKTIIETQKDTKDRYSIVMEHQDKITTENDVVEIANLLLHELDSTNNYFNFIFSKRSLIKSNDQISKIVKKLYMSGHSYFDSALCFDMHFNENDISDEVKTLKLIFHEDFIKMIHAYLVQEQTPNTRNLRLEGILEAVLFSSAEFQLYVARALSTFIVDGFVLLDVLRKLIDVRDILIEEQLEKIKDCYQLTQILGLSLEKTVDIAKKLSHLIQNEEDLYLVSQKLPENERFNFIRDNIDKITTVTDLVKFINRFARDHEKLKVLEIGLKLVNSVEDMRQVLSAFSSSETIKACEIIVSKITDFSQILGLAKLIEPSEQFNFMFKHLNLLKDGFDLVAAFDFCDAKQKHFLIENLKSKVNTGAETVAILKTFDENLRLPIAQMLFSTLHSQQDIDEVRKTLAPQDQKQFAQPEKPSFFGRKLKALFFKEEIVINTQPIPGLIMTTSELGKKSG